MNNSSLCSVCPNNCKIDRDLFVGKCGVNNTIIVARASLHHWEEPVISGTNGSGTIFFSGCTAKCVYCQNYNISQHCFGKEITPLQLANLFKKLENEGAHNINLVSPTQYRNQIINALDIYKPYIPIVYNTNGYETIESIQILNKYVDVYLVDYKYSDDIIAKSLSKITNYTQTVENALSEMIKTKGKPLIEDGLLKKGVIVRHLLLPNQLSNTIGVINNLKSKFCYDNYLLSVMFQYTPCYKATTIPTLNRKIKPLETKIIVNHLLSCGFNDCLIQELSSASTDYIPSFNLEGLNPLDLD